jgi:iron-sulfur cluster insertion protein
VIILNNSAVEKIQDILAEENKPGLKLRIYVQGGGCSGFSYGFKLDYPEPDDHVFQDLVLVDSASMNYMAGARVDYQESLMGSSFILDNPQAVTQCGCGSSFGIGDKYWEE